ncbi:endonuclease/exonuclease/phosphatase family protein [Verrucomicrobium spinosum]|uniref:endonuclease/exonuclease/phosphatase family protein n=1 Tax=Verrucomicrobium spinosum TaxID=2736 RepID=UPI00210E58E2|nr:endonuclease/exonuclease/phosphatase family protein [Verrucomicrobium spinosum]
MLSLNDTPAYLRAWCRLGACGLLLILISAPLNGHASEVVRLVTWNLEWFPGRKPTATQGKKDRHFLEVAAVIPQFRADVMVLQEVRDQDSAEKLAKLMPGFQVHVVSRFKDEVGGAVGLQQIAIMSRFPADGAWLSLGREDGPMHREDMCMRS